MLFDIQKYDSTQSDAWNQCIENSKNGTFLFLRNYMDYHQDRFEDHSLMIYKKKKLVTVLPANIDKDTLVSHGGLTYGGIVYSKNLSLTDLVDLFPQMLDYLKAQGAKKFIYKAVPYIYSNIPADEMLYVLWRNDAQIIKREPSATIQQSYRIPYTKGRKGAVKRGKENGILVRQSDEVETFMQIEADHLREKYDLVPTHSAEEMRLLSSQFPNNIKLFAGYSGDRMLGGTIVYETASVAHTQYISATKEGFEKHVMDVILDFLINDYYQNKAYFDFGISTEQGGQFLNRGLQKNKESFGARTVMYDTYAVQI